MKRFSKRLSNFSDVIDVQARLNKLSTVQISQELQVELQALVTFLSKRRRADFVAHVLIY